MKHFYISVLLLVAFFAISCVPTHENPIKDDSYKLSDINYTYQEIDGHQFMVIRGTSVGSGERKTFVIPIISTNQTDINLELQNFKDWYKSNRIYDDNYVENTKHIDVALALFSEYYERYND